MNEKQAKTGKKPYQKTNNNKKQNQNRDMTAVNRMVNSVVKSGFSQTSESDTKKKPVGMGKTSQKTEKAPSAAPKNNTRSTPQKQRKNTAVSNTAPRNKSKKPQREQISEKPIRIIPLGGLGEIGKNITLFEYDGDMFLVDCGMSFPDDDTPGVDIVIPDFTYVLENKDKIKGLVVTHGHEDHIGAIPYLLRNFNLPIYATRLTIGLISGKLKESRLLGDAKLNVINPGQTVKLGKFSVEFIHVNHSIPDAAGLAITCGAGTVIHTGDFKIDTTPIDDKIIDIARFAHYGSNGVLALLSDSTNAERPGFTASEKTVGESFSKLFAGAGNNRIIVATFSSNIHRIQQIIDEAFKCGRKVAASGRSMLNVISVASELGYLNVPEGVLIDIEEIRNYSPEQLVIATTGSQGETLSALHRMAFGDHRQVQITALDTIILSATPIPGNEKTVSRLVNELMKLGANVVYEKMYDVHVSGHACQEEIKLMMAVCKPKFFVPVHGEQKHLYKSTMVARQMGIDSEHTVIAENGKVIEISRDKIAVTDTVPAGRVLVDGLGVGDVGSIVLRDRKHLSEDGIIVVTVTIDSVTREVIAGPDIVSRGFVYVKESEELMRPLGDLVCDVLEKCYISNVRDWNTIKTRIKDSVSRFLYTKTHRSPIVLPIILEA